MPVTKTPCGRDARVDIRFRLFSNLLHALARKLHFFIGRLQRFLHERMQNNNPMTHQKTIKRPPDTRTTTRPQLKQPVAKSAGVRHTQIRPMLGQQFNDAGIVGQGIDRPRLDLGQHSLVKIFNGLRRVKG